MNGEKTVGELVQEAIQMMDREDWERAIYLFEEALNAGSCDGAFYLAIIYSSGSVGPINLEKSFNYMKIAADIVRRNLFTDLLCGQIFFSLACMYEFGEGTKRDISLALDNYYLAVDLGDTDAMNYLASIYTEGVLVVRNYEISFNFYKMSARLNDSIGLYNAGKMYCDGIGTDRNTFKAFKYIEKSAKMGNFVALTELGKMYESGIGCERDINKAMEYYLCVINDGEMNNGTKLGAQEAYSNYFRLRGENT